MPESSNSNSQGFSLKLGTGPKFGFKNDPDYIFFGEGSSALAKQAVFVDDITQFFPAAQLNVSDQSGELAESFGFVESLAINAELSDTRVNDSVNHDFYWADKQIQDTLLSDHLSGTHIWRLISKFRQDDSLKSQAWGTSTAYHRGVSIKDPILDIANSYNFKKLIIKGVRAGTSVVGEGPLNVDNFYQANKNDFDFIRRLAFDAHDDSDSPYLTFINLQGEFYFTTIAELESAQVDPSLKFKMSIKPLQSLEDDQINRYMVMHGGVPTNEKFYNSLNYYFKYSGSYVPQTTTVKSHFVAPKIQSNEIGNSNDRKYFLRSQYTGNLRNFTDFGILDNDLQLENMRGRIANQHANAMLSNRIVIVVPFKSKAAAGRTVELDFTDGVSNKYSRYAGKWTILRTEHHWNGAKRKLSDKLTLFRSGMDIPKSNRQPFAFIAADF